MKKITPKELWNKMKHHYPANQQFQTEKMFELSGSHKVCWICGDEDRLNLVKTKTSDGREVHAIHCNDCINIQKKMHDTNYLKITRV